MAKILVIDDSRSSLALMVSILSEAAHDVTGCLSAIEALKVLNTATVDIVVTDIYMPEMDGLEFLAHARKTFPLIPVIAISGISGVKSMLKPAKLLGAAVLLSKPFSKEQLLQAVDAVRKR